MAFVNENIASADKERYQFISNCAGSSQWTVDKQNDMFLVYRTGYGPEGPQDERFWAFYWHGHLLDVHIKNLGIETDAENHVRACKRVLRIGGMTRALEVDRRRILEDLKAALAVYGIAGLLLPFKSFDLELETGANSAP